MKKTYNIYVLKKKLNIKETQWFKMTHSGSRTTKPQKDEGIEKAVWVKKKDIIKLKKNMYPSIQDILMNKGILSRQS